MLRLTGGSSYSSSSSSSSSFIADRSPRAPAAEVASSKPKAVLAAKPIAPAKSGSVKAAVSNLKQKANANDPIYLALGQPNSSTSTGKRAREAHDDADADEAATQPQKKSTGQKNDKFTNPKQKGEQVDFTDDDEELDEADEGEGGKVSAAAQKIKELKGGKQTKNFPASLTSGSKAAGGSSSSPSSPPSSRTSSS